MTNLERYFGTPERAARTEVRFDPWPAHISVCEAVQYGEHATWSHRLLAAFDDPEGYLAWLGTEYDDGTIEWEEG